METEAELRALDGKEGESDAVMLTEQNEILDLCEFEKRAYFGYGLTKRQIKRGFVPTHVQKCTYRFGFDRFGHPGLYPENKRLVPISESEAPK